MQDYGNYEELSSGAAIATMAITFIVGLVFGIFFIIVGWKIFVKAGKPGWATIIRIYSTIVFLEIIGKPIWWLFLLIIPGVNIIFGIWALNLFFKSFGKEVPLWTILGVFFSIIILPIIAFGDARYIGPTAAEAQGGDSFLKS